MLLKSHIFLALLASLFAAEQPKALFDFRAAAPQSNSTPPPSSEMRQKLLSAIFPRYLQSEAACRPNATATDTGLRVSRETGQIVPQIQAEATGSFTRAGARQQLYLIKVGECGATGRNYFGTYRAAVFEDGRLVVSAASPGDSIPVVRDIDGDGIDQLLIAGCGSGTGEVHCAAVLVSMSGGSLRTVRKFESVYSDPCGYSLDLSITAVAIRYSPGRPPRFFEDRYEAACPASGQPPQFRPAPSR